jgi:hypothetical protein
MAPESGAMRGLGLLITKAIVDAHGGATGASARVDGARVVGARVWLTLPRPR